MHSLGNSMPKWVCERTRTIPGSTQLICPGQRNRRKVNMQWQGSASSAEECLLILTAEGWTLHLPFRQEDAQIMRIDRLREDLWIKLVFFPKCHCYLTVLNLNDQKKSYKLTWTQGKELEAPSDLTIHEATKSITTSVAFCLSKVSKSKSSFRPSSEYADCAAASWQDLSQLENLNGTSVIGGPWKIGATCWTLRLVEAEQIAKTIRRRAVLIICGERFLLVPAKLRNFSAVGDFNDWGYRVQIKGLQIQLSLYHHLLESPVYHFDYDRESNKLVHPVQFEPDQSEALNLLSNEVSWPLFYAWPGNW